MKIIIAGCRTFNNYDRLKLEVDKILIDYENYQITIVSGCARGVDTLGEQYAKEKGYEIEKYPADWQKFNKSAGYIRNSEMAKVGDMLIAFWDYESPGTKHMIDLANDNGLIVRIIDIRGILRTCSITTMKNLPDNVIKLLVTRKTIPNMPKYGLHHVLSLAPSAELFNDMKSKKITWKQYVVRYRQEMVKNMQPTLDKIEKNLMNGNDIALICYCTKFNECHRGILGSYFKDLGFEIILM